MSGNQIFSDSLIAFNTQCDVVFPEMEASRAKHLLQKIKNEISQIELAVSRSSEVSEIWQVNNSPKNEWVSVSDDLWELLNISADFYAMSNGAFDVTFAPLFEAWKTEDSLSETKITELRSACGFDKVEIDTDKQRFRFLADGMQFDFGALEKVYALEVLKDLLKQEGVSAAIVSFEEECVLALGKHPGGEDWPMGIRNLDTPNEFVHVFTLADELVVSTGTEYIDLETGTLKGRKILSPETGKVLEGRKTVSVKAKSALIAAFVSYCWLILPENDQSIVADQLKDIEVFECEYLEDDVKTKQTLIGEEN